jgi:hypothetical protein
VVESVRVKKEVSARLSLHLSAGRGRGRDWELDREKEHAFFLCLREMEREKRRERRGWERGSRGDVETEEKREKGQTLLRP